jgi:hypothetical protein
VNEKEEPKENGRRFVYCGKTGCTLCRNLRVICKKEGHISRWAHDCRGPETHWCQLLILSPEFCSSFFDYVSDLFLKIVCHKRPVSDLITKCFQGSLFESHIRHVLFVYMEDTWHIRRARFRSIPYLVKDVVQCHLEKSLV